MVTAVARSGSPLQIYQRFQIGEGRGRIRIEKRGLSWRLGAMRGTRRQLSEGTLQGLDLDRGQQGVEGGENTFVEPRELLGTDLQLWKRPGWIHKGREGVGEDEEQWVR